MLKCACHESSALLLPAFWRHRVHQPTQVEEFSRFNYFIVFVKLVGSIKVNRSLHS